MPTRCCTNLSPAAILAAASNFVLRADRRARRRDWTNNAADLDLNVTPCTLHVFEAGLVCRLVGWAGLPGATFCPLCREYLGGTCAPVGWPRCKSSGELRQERQYRD